MSIASVNDALSWAIAEAAASGSMAVDLEVGSEPEEEGAAQPERETDVRSTSSTTALGWAVHGVRLGVVHGVDIVHPGGR